MDDQPTGDQPRRARQLGIAPGRLAPGRRNAIMATTTRGYRGHVKYACPQDFVISACRAAGVLGEPA